VTFDGYQICASERPLFAPPVTATANSRAVLTKNEHVRSGAKPISKLFTAATLLASIRIVTRKIPVYDVPANTDKC
jgi:hypothetical protein